MSKKLWQKNTEVNKNTENFTVGKDRELDVFLAPWDILGSLAHVTMLEQIKLITSDELSILSKELKCLYFDCIENGFVIEEGVEDVHSQVEMLLTQRLGDVGKKIHSGRSRNDQVLLDLKLFTRHELQNMVTHTTDLFRTLIKQSEANKNTLLPGYTHLQIAMPSSAGLFFGAYAESLVDDLQLLLAAWKVNNKNPLGSAAGYGSSFPLNRQLTTDLLGFDSLNYNVVYAQMGRGKMEKTVSFALASLAGTLSKLAFDCCLYMNQNFGFISIPDKYTTGSSIMPHKKNPDIFELIRGKCNKIQALPQQIMMISNNLPSGYFRDLQIIKEVFIPVFQELQDCLLITQEIMEQIQFKQDILSDDKYQYLFSVEEVNKRVLAGMPFREAYKQVGLEIEAGAVRFSKEIHHTHEGSIGNLCNDAVVGMYEEILNSFSFARVDEALQKLSQL